MKVSVNKKRTNPDPATPEYQQLQRFIQFLSTWDSIAKYAKRAAFLVYGLDEYDKNAKEEMNSFQVIQAKGEVIYDPAIYGVFGTRFGGYDVMISATLYSRRGIIVLNTRLSQMYHLRGCTSKEKIGASISAVKYVREET